MNRSTRRKGAMMTVVMLVLAMICTPFAMADRGGEDVASGRGFSGGIGGEGERYFSGGRGGQGEVIQRGGGRSTDTYYGVSFSDLLNYAGGLIIGGTLLDGIKDYANVLFGSPTEADGAVVAGTYGAYVRMVQEELGTGILTDKGIIYPLTFYDMDSEANNTGEKIKGGTYPNYAEGYHFNGSYYTKEIHSNTLIIDIPTLGKVEYICEVIQSERSFLTPIAQEVKNVTKGIYYSNPMRINRSNNGIASWHYAKYRAYILYTPHIYSPNTYTAAIGGISSRPGAMKDIYGYIDGDGNYCVSGENNIINEGTSTYYNPATDNSQTITDWTYDYSTRTYEAYAENGDIVTVNYGDEYITINEGDTVYNVYYLAEKEAVEESLGITPTPEPTPTDEPDPNANPGDGGDEEHTPTPTPNDSGGGGDGDGDEGGGNWWDGIGSIVTFIIELIGSIIKGIVGGISMLFETIGDSIINMVTTVMEAFAQIPKMFGGFMQLLGGFYQYLPTELVSVMVGGIGLIVIAGIIKIFIR